MIPREVVAVLARRRLVAEVRTETAQQALYAVEALLGGGISSIEVSMAIPGVQEILSHFAARQDVLIGAGAVLDARQAAEAISCGARFIASPILSLELVPVCTEAHVACMLGAMTPSEIIAAQRGGAEMVKLFPTHALGGPTYVRALFDQLTHLSLQVSGGLTADTLGGYLELPVRSIALGSLLLPRQLVERGSWQALTSRARAFVEYAANPHVYAARFLAMMGVAPRAPQPQIAPQPLMPGQPPVAALPAPGMVSAGGSMPGADANGGFKPWDSRPIEGGDEEDWLR